MTLTSKERSKISKNNMAKATAFQRKVAKILEAWFKEHGVNGEFHSTPRSGGLRWQGRSDVIGDVVTPENFVFTIECKKHNDIDLQVMFLTRPANTSQDIINFWTQVCNDAVRAEREPLLAFECKRGKTIVIIPAVIWEDVLGIQSDKTEGVMRAYINVLDINSEWCHICMAMINTMLELTTPTRTLTTGD